MKFSTQQLPSGKWGIYSGECLLATVDCQSTCETILANFVSGRRDAPDNDVNELYQAHQLRHEKAAAEKAALEEKTVEEKTVSSSAESARANAQTTTNGQSSELADKGVQVTQPTGVKASTAKTPSSKSKTKSKTKRKSTSAKRVRKSDKRSQATPASA